MLTFWYKLIHYVDVTIAQLKDLPNLYRAWRYPPVPRDPARAQQYLQNAMTYFDKWEDAKDWNDKFRHLRFAARQIEEAKRYDPHAVFHFNNRDGKPDAWDIKQFSAEALYFQAINEMNWRRYRKAIRVLKRALEFVPHAPDYQNMLAEAYIKNRQRAKAKEVLKNVNLPNHRTLELQDRLKSDWMLGGPLTPGAIAFVSSIACFIIAYNLFDGKNPFASFWPFFWAAVGAICFWTMGQIRAENEVRRSGQSPLYSRGEHDL